MRLLFSKVELLEHPLDDPGVDAGLTDEVILPRATASLFPEFLGVFYSY